MKTRLWIKWYGAGNRKGLCANNIQRNNCSVLSSVPVPSENASMTSLVLQWLNEDLTLHRKVLVLERDLCNGYILAEILHVHGLESHLERYSDSSEITTRINNLELLAKTMASAGIGELSVNTRRAVMMEDRSAILQLVLQVKEHLKKRGKRVSTEQKQLENVASRVYEPVQKNSGQPGVQDVEDRFVRETAHRYHPKELRFYKEINSAVHLRKFPQAKWTKENEQWEYDAKMGAQHAQESAANRTALRHHLTEKREFMKEWDKERFLKWQQTQDEDVAAERTDLRLELTLEERKRRLHEVTRTAIQRDARGGVVEFEKNMNRLGLGGSATNGGGAEPPLRAIPSTDPGAVAHLDRLEKRVQDLAFRPSNNVQMMKELRARRKAQLAAEKDRRMRRMRAVGDATKGDSTVGDSTKAIEVEGVEAPTSDLPSSNSAVDEALEHADLHQLFLDQNRDALEANYTRLREIGSQRRSADAEELERLRFERRLGSHRRHREMCGEIINYLVDQVFSSAAIGVPDSGVPLDASAEEELEVFTESFMNHSNVWATYSLSLASVPTQSLSQRIEAFVHDALAADSTHLVTPSWALREFKIVTVFTSDERGCGVAHRVAADHHMHCVSVDELLDECVKHSYDPVKQAEHAATLSERERELGLFGPKLAALRQKNTPVPEAMAVEIVVATVQLARRESTVESGENVERTLASSVQRCGLMLHNFPRSVDEWKLFEKALVMAQPIEEGADDSNRLAQVAAIEATTVAGSSDSSSSSECSSSISAAIILSAFPSLEADVSTSSLPEPTSAERRRSSAVASEPAESPTKRQSVVVDPMIAVKAEEAKDALRRRQQVEQLLTRTSWVVSVDCTEMEERVVEEIAHIAISVYTSGEALESRQLQCDSSVQLPEPLHAARCKLREEMPILERIAWMVASGELSLDERSLMELVMSVRKCEQRLTANLRRLFREALAALQQISASSRSIHRDLDGVLQATETDCASVLRRGEQQLRANDWKRDKSLTATEVALGDAVEHHRKRAADFIRQVEEQPAPESLGHAVRWLRVLPLVCLELKEFAVDTALLLQTQFYAQFPFLEVRKSQVFPLLGCIKESEGVREAVAELDQLCETRGLDCSLLHDVTRLVDQLASRDESVSDATAYALANTTVLREFAQSALGKMTMLARWSATLLDSVVTAHEQDVEMMHRYLQRDVRHSNQAIAQVVASLSLKGSADWPRLGAEMQAEVRTRHEQAAFLSVIQLETLIEACRAAEKSSRLPQDAFVSAVLDTARHHQFPASWQDSTAVARVAMAWSDPSRPLVRWRQLVFSLLCTQFIGYPSTDSLLHAVDQLKQLTGPSIDYNTTITRHEFESRVSLWFDAEAEYKQLLALLFASDAAPDRLEIVPMLLTWCVAPAFLRSVRGDVAAATLPPHSRGLQRAFICLVRLLSTTEFTLDHFTHLLAVTATDIDKTRPPYRDDENTEAFSWRPHDVNRFLGACDGYDPSIARWFLERDTFAALLDTRELY